jgi:hypothetical protein
MAYDVIHAILLGDLDGIVDAPIVDNQPLDAVEAGNRTRQVA